MKNPSVEDMEWKPQPLSAEEREALADCERTINEGAIPFVEVGRALAKIKKGNLYRETHENFDSYCLERFDFRRAHAHRLLREAEMMIELQETFQNGHKVLLPTNEGQARELLAVPRKHRLEVLKLAAESTTNGSLSARLIQEASEKLTGKRVTGTSRRNGDDRFSVEWNVFLAWVERLKTAIEEGRKDDALDQIDDLVRTRQIDFEAETPTDKSNKGENRFRDCYKIGGDESSITGTDKKSRELRLKANLEDKEGFKAWATQHGFKEPAFRNQDEHWILKSENLTAHWWPRTAKLALNQDLRHGIKTCGWRQVCEVLEVFQRTGSLEALPMAKSSNKRGNTRTVAKAVEVK
jgi:hypothetical protein